MELVIVSGCVALFLGSLIGAGAVVGFICGLWYAKSYYDGSETDGRRHWPALQDRVANNCLVTLLRQHWVRHRVCFIRSDGSEHSEMSDEYAAALKKDNALFAGHPHGLIALGSLLTVGLPRNKPNGALWRTMRPAVHRHVFAVPVLRELALWLGAIDASRDNIVAALQTRGSVYLAPGGCREMILTKDAPIQSRHTGFLRIAWSQKCLVFPVLHSGQDAVFRSFSFAWLDRVRHVCLDVTGYPFPTFFLGPFPAPLTTYLLDPHDPARFETEADFIDAYFASIRDTNARLLL